MRTIGRRTALFGTFLGCAVAATTVLTAGQSPVGAHGSASDPPSRIYACRFLEPDNSNCDAAWSANPQALYDWNEVNLGDVNGRHEERIPDGQLCSAGRAKYAAFDVANADWPSTDVSPGPFTMTYTASAPHATAYFRLYITDANHNPTQPLNWDDLSLVFDSGALPARASYDFDMVLPNRTGRHVLYLIWQRSDSPEAFYSCNDVDFGGGTTPSTAPPTTAPPTTAPATTAPATTAPATTAPATTAPATTAPATTAPATTAPSTTTAPSNGTWSSSDSYFAGEVVTHNGSTYQAKWWSQDFAPDTTVAHAWETPWEVIGAIAPPATVEPPIVGAAAWNPFGVYFAGARVERSGGIYEAKWWSRGTNPAAPVNHPWETPWRLVGPSR